jgi:hypothetical protein
MSWEMCGIPVYFQFRSSCLEQEYCLQRAAAHKGSKSMQKLDSHTDNCQKLNVAFKSSEGLQFMETTPCFGEMHCDAPCKITKSALPSDAAKPPAHLAVFARLIMVPK